MLPFCKGEQCITTIPSNNWAQSLDVAVRQPLSAVLWQTNSEAGQTFQDNIEYHFPSGHLYCSKSHRIGWWENLQETHIFHGKNLGLRLRFSQENQSIEHATAATAEEFPRSRTSRGPWLQHRHHCNRLHQGRKLMCLAGQTTVIPWNTGGNHIFRLLHILGLHIILMTHMISSLSLPLGYYGFWLSHHYWYMP